MSAEHSWTRLIFILTVLSQFGCTVEQDQIDGQVLR